MSSDNNVRIFKIIDRNTEGEIELSEHCEILPFLKRIKTTFRKDYMKVYAYLAYMTMEDPVENPYFNISMYEREFEILKDLEFDVDIEHPVIIAALERLNKMYTLPSSDAYKSIAETLHKIALNLRNAPSLDMDAAAIKSVMTIAKEFKDVKKTFDESRRDMIIESKENKNPRQRGNVEVAYDE